MVYDSQTRDAIIIDPVLDYDPVGSKIWTESVDEVIDYVKSNELSLHLVMETHAHADHISGAQMIKEQYPDAVFKRLEETGEASTLAPFTWLTCSLMATEIMKVVLGWGALALAPNFATYDPLSHRSSINQ